MENLKNITVLMSTYNGQKYIREQLESILNQREVNVKLIIRDDCSTDNTIKILEDYKKRNSNIKIIQGKENKKPCGSFFELINSNYSDEYYALSDQDDIWDDDKLISAIHMLEKVEDGKPAMYYSNLRIVDSENRFYRNSHKSFRNCEKKYISLMETSATGCTIVYNNSLAKVAHMKKPNKFSMHDTWIYMTALFFGNVVYDFEPHINYRQHENNVIGTQLKRNIGKSFLKEIRRFFNRKVQPRYDNAVEFLRQFGNDLTDDDLQKILEVVNYKRNMENRIKLIKDKDFWSNDKGQRIKFWLLVMLGII